MSQRNLAPGLILVGLGVLLLLVRLTWIGGEAVVAVIGAGFLITYFATRKYGFLVPAGIMLGLGLGIIWEVNTGSGGGPVLIGLGLGFVSVWLIAEVMRDPIQHWWPLVPGGIIAAIGVLVEAEQTGFLDSYGDLWPLILVVIGAVLLLSGTAQRTAPPDEPRETTRSEKPV